MYKPEISTGPTNNYQLESVMKGKLRWKRKPRETGLSSIGATPRGYEYHDGEKTYASISANGGGWRSEQKGWYWVAFGEVPYKNTCHSPCETVEQAKAEASDYVRKNLPAK